MVNEKVSTIYSTSSNATIVKQLKTLIAAGGMHTLGLKTDGTVLSVGKNQNGQTNV